MTFDSRDEHCSTEYTDTNGARGGAQRSLENENVSVRIDR